MKLCVLTCATFPANKVNDKLWIFLRSMEKFGKGYPLFMYGVGRQFPGYREMMLDWQLEMLKTLRGYTHVLFTDGWDAFFCGPIGEIEDKYLALGAPPMLCSAYHQLGNADATQYSGCFDESLYYRYPNRGGYIAEISAIIEAFERMLAAPGLTGDDCFEWYRGWKEGWFRPQLDYGCSIFHISEDHLSLMGKITVDDVKMRPANMITGSFPGILHLSGGYTDPEVGKDARMIPWARLAGVIE